MPLINHKGRDGNLTRLIFEDNSSKHFEKVREITEGCICSAGVTFPVDETLVSELQRKIPNIYLPPIVRKWYEEQMIDAVDAYELHRNPPTKWSIDEFSRRRQGAIFVSPFGCGLRKLFEEQGKRRCVITEEEFFDLWPGALVMTLEQTLEPQAKALLRASEVIIVDMPLLEKGHVIFHLLKEGWVRGKQVIFLLPPSIWESPEIMWGYLNCLDEVKFPAILNFVRRFTLYTPTKQGRRFLGMKNEDTLIELLSRYVMNVNSTSIMLETETREETLYISLSKEHIDMVEDISGYGITKEAKRGLIVSPLDYGQYPYQPFTPLLLSLVEKIVKGGETVVIRLPYLEYRMSLNHSLQIMGLRSSFSSRYFEKEKIEDLKNKDADVYITSGKEDVKIEADHLILLEEEEEEDFSGLYKIRMIWRLNNEEV